MKTLAIENIHKSLGAKMVPFAGYNMPIEYSGLIDEHVSVRTKAGIFDVSHMGEFWAKGPGAKDLLQKITVNDVSVLTVGKAQYTCLPNGKGGIVDDLIIYQYDEEKYMLVVNAANIEKDWEWINSQNTEGVELENASDKIGLFAIQGPEASKILQQLTSENLDEIKPFHFVTGQLAGINDVIISNTGYTGEKGFELYFYNQFADKIWTEVMKAGEPLGLKPIGLGARDTLRMEMGYCLYGNDIDDTTSTLEAGLGWVTKINDNNDFIDKEYLIKQKEEGIKRKLTGFELIDRGIPRKDYEICDEEGKPIGKVTSGTMSPMLKKGIGLGYISKEFSKPETNITIKIRNKLLKAQVVKLPIYKK